jgi:hypothetical protein
MVTNQEPCHGGAGLEAWEPCLGSSSSGQIVKGDFAVGVTFQQMYGRWRTKAGDIWGEVPGKEGEQCVQRA